MYQKILEKYGLTWEELDSPGHSGEKEVLQQWAEKIQKKEVSSSDIKDHIGSMRYITEIALVNEPEYIPSKIFPFIKVRNDKNIFLKARLHNYLILEAFISGPGRARKSVEKALESIQASKQGKKL